MPPVLPVVHAQTAAPAQVSLSEVPAELLLILDAALAASNIPSLLAHVQPAIWLLALVCLAMPITMLMA